MLIRLLMPALILMLSSAAYAGRDVSIALQAGQQDIILTNPSTVAVNYNITCHKADGSSTLLALTNQNLAPNARAVHTAMLPDSELCAGSASPIYQGFDQNSKKYYMCNGSNTYATANNACGTGNSFCYPDLNSAPWQCSGNGFWVKNDGGVQHQTWCGSFTTVTGGLQVTVGMASGTGYARKNASGSPCGNFPNADAVSPTSSAGSLCCSAPVTASLCKVTVNTTATNAYLSSPSFMGGAAF